MFFLKQDKESDGILRDYINFQNEIFKINLILNKHVLKWPRHYGN